jgi:hypothetical protein
MNIDSIECFESFKDELRQCEKCQSILHLDDGFLDINEICDGTDQAINDYEKKHNVDLLNFWCECCARDAINEIEGNKK